MIKTIRRFNRFYTNTLGLLNQHLLDSEFSLAEARILYDIAHTKDCTAKKLIEELSLDAGYLSRVIKRFEKKGLVYREQSQEDGRIYYLYLTENGKKAFDRLDQLSNSQINHMLNGLSKKDQILIAESMNNIERALSKKHLADNENFSIRTDLRPGDVGEVIQLHGWIYAVECGYNQVFEAYVCKTFFDFLLKYDPQKDRIWFAEADGKIIGAIAIVGHTAVRAQLRWFILHPAYRDRGLGKKLLKEAIDFSRNNGYRQVFLDTTNEQTKAIEMYKKAGFRKVAEHANDTWGKALFEETYELNFNDV